MHPTFFVKCHRKICIWLIPAGNLCGIVRAVYLNPLLACQLCLSWWQYLRRTAGAEDLGNQPASSKRLWVQRSAEVLRFPSALRLLRGVAFSITLMLPADGWAQATASSANLVLPDAPRCPAKRGCSPTNDNLEHKPRPSSSDICKVNGNDCRHAEEGRAPAHFRRCSQLQYSRQCRWHGEALASTEIPSGL
jgi:hypothetical protein